MPEEVQPRVKQMSDFLGEFVNDAAARHEAKLTGKPIGAVTGFPKLDDALGGSLAPGLHILHGSPGSGKTAFALQVAALCECPALFVTCEMSPIELLRRLTARVSGQYLGRFKTGEMTPGEARSHAERAVAQVPMLTMLDATRTGISPSDIRTAAETTRRLCPGNPHLLIVIDSVHSWVRAFSAGLEEYSALTAGLDALRTIAQEMNCAVLGIGERNRASMQAGGQSAAAGTRSFEYSSESVIELEAKKEPVDADGRTRVEVLLSKNRNGSPGKRVVMLFTGSLQDFREE